MKKMIIAHYRALVIIAFRLRAGFGLIVQHYRALRKAGYVIIAFRLRAGFGLLYRPPQLVWGTGVIIAFRLRAGFGLLDVKDSIADDAKS